MGRGRWLAWQAVVWGDTMKTAEGGTEKQTPQKTLLHSIQLKIFSCSQYSHVDHRPPFSLHVPIASSENELTAEPIGNGYDLLYLLYLSSQLSHY